MHSSLQCSPVLSGALVGKVVHLRWFESLRLLESCTTERLSSLQCFSPKSYDVVQVVHLKWFES